MFHRGKTSSRSRQHLEDRTNRRPTVFSYHSARSHDTSTAGRLKPEDAKTASRQWSWRALPTFLSWAVIVGSLIYVTTLGGRFGLNITGNTLALPHDKAYYQQTIKNIFAASVFNKNKLTINTNRLAQNIKERFPEVKTAVITVPLIGHSPMVSLEMLTPALILRDASDGEYAVDGQGRAFASINKANNPYANIATVEDQSGIGIEVGKQVIAKETVVFINKVVYQLQAAHINIKSLSLPPRVDELNILLTDQPYTIKMATSGDPLLQAGTYLAVRKELSSHNTVPKYYVDVRAEERAFYK